MAADYVLRFPCPVRRQVPEDKLVTLVGYMSLAEFAVAQIRQAQPDASIESILGGYEVHVSQTRPDGTTHQVPMRLGQLVDMAQALAPHRGHCADCRANIADRHFGCIAKINYPIQPESEQWLLSRLPADPQDPNLVLLLRMLSQLRMDGGPVDAMRPRLFVSPQPALRRWGAAGMPQQQISSSQIIQLLLFNGPVSPQRAGLYAKLLGLATVLSDPHPPSANIEQFKTLMCAIVMAGRLGAEITMDA